MLKKVMTLICFCCYLCFMQIGFAQDIIKQETPQKQTLKVAILPTLSNSQRYPDVNQLLYNNLTQEMHVPLMILYKQLNILMKTVFMLR